MRIIIWILVFLEDGVVYCKKYLRLPVQPRYHWMECKPIRWRQQTSI